ncbi:FAD-dependent oxidoreductase [Leucobacter allii]|uniref:FAD-dependent oxidoreductase n=1 Tax=Leucobacter allii TaxID=2932247 RepID=A0ABY4FJA9_9MICO|nr:FAD-dependent oxidoreductase [Leucobacter allii]UOQ56655.1 FAD-dependent oxidoreductase [Leucobacter allii]UOR01090.1 FAD-dependent oxidoreductase [Leucobacter allii]
MSTRTERIDHLVVGGGAMGLAAAWQLAGRGARVLLLERFAPHHARGASHGSTRNLNNAYDEEHYLDLFDEAVGLWRGLESATGAELLGLHGLVTHGDGALVGAAHDALARRGASIALLSADAAATRWPGMRFQGEVLLSEDAGVVRAARALDALTDAARAAGARIEHGVRVHGLEPGADGVRVIATGADGAVREILAGHATVTAGAWSDPLLAGLVELPELTVTEEHPAHFAPRDAGTVWPSFNHLLESDDLDAFDGNVYGMPSPGEGVKVGFHKVGAVVDPDDRPFRASEAQRAALRDYVADWFPGLVPESAEEISCTYTSTATGRFVLDTVGPITVGAGFSGHGFKFTPAIGRVLADAATGAARPPEPFRLAAHQG